MGFKPGDNVAVADDEHPNVIGRVVAHLGEGWFSVEIDGGPEVRRVSARELRHLDSVKVRILRQGT